MNLSLLEEEATSRVGEVEEAELLIKEMRNEMGL